MLQFIFDTFSRTSELAIIAMGISLVYGLSKFPNIAHVQYAMLGAYVSVWLQHLNAPLALCIPLASLVVAVFAMLMQLIVFGRLMRSGSVIAMIGSFALAMIIIASILGIAGSSPIQYQLPLSPPMMFMDAILSASQIASICITAVAIMLVSIMLYQTRLGLSMRALASNRPLASTSGLDTEGITRRVNFLGGGLAGLGGAVLALTTGAYTNIGNDLLLPIFAAAVLGGLGNPLGAVVGALIIALAETLVTSLNIGRLYGEALAFIPAGYISMASFVILLVTLILRPYGLFDREVRRV